VHTIQGLRPTLLLHAEVGYASQRRRSTTTKQWEIAKSYLADESDWYAKVTWRKRKPLVDLVSEMIDVCHADLTANSHRSEAIVHSRIDRHSSRPISVSWIVLGTHCLVIIRIKVTFMKVEPELVSISVQIQIDLS
jgi:hypothetical protein